MSTAAENLFAGVEREVLQLMQCAGLSRVFPQGAQAAFDLCIHRYLTLTLEHCENDPLSANS